MLGLKPVILGAGAMLSASRSLFLLQPFFEFRDFARGESSIRGHVAEVDEDPNWV